MVKSKLKQPTARDIPSLKESTVLMGFTWGANVEIVFGAQLQIPRHTARLVKRLAMWQPPQNTLFEIAAKRVCLDDVPDTVRTRAKIAAKEVADYSEIPEDAEMEAYEWSDMPDETDEPTQRFLEELKKATFGFASYDTECTLELECCPKYFNKAFQLAARRLFGTDDHGLELIFETGGADGNVGEGASDKLMMIRAVDQNERDGLDAPRGGIGGVPWGCMVTPLPTKRRRSKRQKIKMAIKAFGFRVEKKTGWHLVTVASGG